MQQNSASWPLHEKILILLVSGILHALFCFSFGGEKQKDRPSYNYQVIMLHFEVIISRTLIDSCYLGSKPGWGAETTVELAGLFLLVLKTKDVPVVPVSGGMRFEETYIFRRDNIKLHLSRADNIKLSACV
ncbi:hypothetical protein CsatA_021859 [Cannabis sativa]